MACQMTLTYKDTLTLDSYSVDVCLFNFYKQNYIQNNTKFIASAYPGH